MSPKIRKGLRKMTLIQINIHENQALEVLVRFGEELAVRAVDAGVAVVAVGRLGVGVFGFGGAFEDAGLGDALEGGEDVGAGFDGVGGGDDVAVWVGDVGVWVLFCLVNIVIRLFSYLRSEYGWICLGRWARRLRGPVTLLVI